MVSEGMDSRRGRKGETESTCALDGPSHLKPLQGLGFVLAPMHAFSSSPSKIRGYLSGMPYRGLETLMLSYHTTRAA